MAFKITCSICGHQKTVRWGYYKKHLLDFNVTTKQELNELYCCRDCRDIAKICYIRDTPEFKKLKRLLTIEHSRLLRNGGKHSREAMEHFKKNVTLILDKCFIFSHTYSIKGDELIGIVLHNVSFYGDILVSFKDMRNRNSL